MTKLEQFSSEFNVLYSRENSPWVEEIQCLARSEHSARGVLGKIKFYRALEEQDWLGDWEFLYKASRSYFLG